MKNLRFLFPIMSVLMLTNACDQDKIYKEELYQQVIALVCSDNYNILEYTHKLEGEELGYIVASCGGTRTVEKDVHISLKEDQSVLDDYNLTMYDQTKYARFLPSSKYVIDNRQITIPKGKHSGWMSIRFRLEGLSPDSAYFLPLSIESVSAYKVNPDKSNILYRVLIKNQYAEQLVAGYTNYRLDGFVNTTATTILQKPVQPLAANKVRMMAGNLAFSASIPTFEAGAIVLEITGKQVQIKPYKENGTLIVTQLDNDPLYPNTYQIVSEWDRKYKEFLLNYTYKAGSAAVVQMRERLRLEITD